MATAQRTSAGMPKSRADLEKDRIKRQVRTTTKTLTPVKLYLVAYNLISAALWGYLLVLTISYVIRTVPTGTYARFGWFSRLARWTGVGSRPVTFAYSRLITRLEGSYEYNNLGYLTKYVQSLAILEVVHAALGLVRSPVGTTAAQVASRLWTVWGVVEASPATHNSPLFSTMLFAWSLTEVIRYIYYATSVLGISSPILDWLRYTTFIPLYPLGASSEAFLSFNTLPALSTLPFLPKSLAQWSPLNALSRVIPYSVQKYMMKTASGRLLLWNMAKQKTKASAAGALGMSNKWGWLELMRLALFVIWWPALYVLYTYMLKQRRRVLNKGKVVGGANKAN